MDVNADLQAQLEMARETRAAVEAERDARKRAIDTEYEAKVKGLEKVIAGYLESLGLGHPLLVPEAAGHRLIPTASESIAYQRESGVTTIKESIMADLLSASDRGLTTDELTAGAQRRGFMKDAKTPKDTIRSTLYDMRDKGVPIDRVAPKTWKIVPPRPDHDAEATPPPRQNVQPYPPPPPPRLLPMRAPIGR